VGDLLLYAHRRLNVLRVRECNADTHTYVKYDLIVAAYLNWLKYPLSESIQGLELGFKHAVAGGNPAFGTGCAYNLVGSLWFSVPLPQIVSCSGAFSPSLSSLRECRAWHVRHFLILIFSVLFPL
jgi:hypothetical protein